MSPQEVAAMVLAAGLGTRLSPYTASHPKPLLPLFDVPVLELTLCRLARAGIRNIVVNAFHHADELTAFVGRLGKELGSQYPGLTLQVSCEDVLLGTGGGIARARRFFDGLPLLVVNGDVLWEFDVFRLLGRHASAGGAATLLLHPGATPDAPRTTLVAPDGRVTAIRPRGGGPEACVFTGIYVLEPSLYRMLPERFCSVIEEGLWPALRQDLPVSSVVADFPWFDLGTWVQVMEAARQVLSSPAQQFALLRSLSPGVFHEGDQRAEEVHKLPVSSAQRTSIAPLPPAAGPGWYVGTEAGWYVGTEACVASGARIGPGSVVSSGATLTSDARVERVLLLSGATVEGELADAVAGPDWVLRMQRQSQRTGS